MLYEIFLVAMTSMSPVVELNGGIPLGVYLGMNPLMAFFVAVIANLTVFFPLFFLIDFFYNLLFSKIHLFQRFLDRVRRKAHPHVEKYGYLGLTVFIAIPTPFTGAYTGALAAWMLRMDWKRSFLAISLGVLINGFIIMLAVMGLLNGLGFFLK